MTLGKPLGDGCDGFFKMLLLPSHVYPSFCLTAFLRPCVSMSKNPSHPSHAPPRKGQSEHPVSIAVFVFSEAEAGQAVAETLDG